MSQHTGETRLPRRRKRHTARKGGESKVLGETGKGLKINIPAPGLTGPTAPAAVTTQPARRDRGATALVAASGGKRGVREARAGSGRPPRPAPPPLPPHGPAGRNNGGENPPPPLWGGGRPAERETPAPLSLLPPRGGMGLGCGGTAAAEPLPAPAGEKEGGGTEWGRQVSSCIPTGSPPRPDRVEPPPLSRLPLPWPPSPPSRRSPARRSLPPSPSSRCNGSGAESGAEPSGGSRRRRPPLNPLPAGQRGGLTPPAPR